MLQLFMHFLCVCVILSSHCFTSPVLQSGHQHCQSGVTSIASQVTLGRIAFVFGIRCGYVVDQWVHPIGHMNSRTTTLIEGAARVHGLGTIPNHAEAVAPHSNVYQPPPPVLFGFCVSRI